MKTKIYQVDAFTDSVFSGNPAAVCPLEYWLSDDILQKIANENNLSDTAFYVKEDNGYQIRWFTPTVEVDLCGHATLAAAFVLFNLEGHTDEIIRFTTKRSGELSVYKKDNALWLNFPTDIFKSIEISEALINCVDIKPTEALKGKTDYVLVFQSEKQIHDIHPQLSKIAQLDGRGLIVTAPGENVDFVSRFFGPKAGINEDPVTGSAHTTLTPYWASKLNKQTLTAIQLSQRRGHLTCKYLDDRVEIGGQAALYLTGDIYIPG